MPSRRAFLAACSAGAVTLGGCSALTAPAERRWRATAYGHNPTRPTVADDVVLVAVQRSGAPPGLLYAFGTDTGEQVYQRSIPEPRSRPVVRDDVVAIGMAGGIYAATLSEGTRRWQVDTAGLVRGVAAAPEGFYAAVADRRVVAVSPEGERRWTADLPAIGPLAATSVAVVAVDRLSPEETGVVALDPDAGDRRWRVSAGLSRMGALAVAVDGTRAVIVSRRVTVRDLADGGVRWQFDPGEEALATRPCVVNRAVHVGGGISLGDREYGTVFSLPLDGGSPGLEYRADHPVTALAGDERALFVRADRTLRAVDPESMAARWTVDVPYGSVAGADGVCYLATEADDGARVLAYDGE